MTTPIGQAVASRLDPWLRTVVPVAWSALIAWLVSSGVLPDQVETWASGLGGAIATVIVTGIVYPAIRWVEPKLPPWLTRLLIGSVMQPVYVEPAVAAAVSDPTSLNPVVEVVPDKSGDV